MINFLFSNMNYDESWASSYVAEKVDSSSQILVIPYSYMESEVHDNDSWQKVYTPGGKYYEEICNSFSGFGVEKTKLNF